MSITINFPGSLAAGCLSLFKLQDNNHLLVLFYNLGYEFLPVIGKKIYIESDDTETQDQLEEIVKLIVAKKIFPELNDKIPRIQKAPEFTKIVTGICKTPGMRKYKGINKILESNKYVIEKKSAPRVITRNYDELLKTNEFAQSVFTETRAELKKVGATFDKISLEAKQAYKCILTGQSEGIIFDGPTGTGKSWLARIIADKMGGPLWTLQIQGGTTVDALVGSFIPKAGETVSTELAAKIVDTIKNKELSVFEAIEKASELIKLFGEQAKWEFVRGPLLRAYIEGWILCLEEANFGDPRVLAVINQFTDGTLRVTVNGIPYKKHVNFCIMLTGNAGYDGTEKFNASLKNRFSVVNVPKLTKTQFTEWIVAYSKTLGHALSNEFFGKLFDFANKIEKLAKDARFHEDVHFSIRNARRLCDGVLIERCSFEEFSAAIAIQYLNHLSLDNDNSEELQKLKADPSIINDINQLYELYDFADIPTVDTVPSLSNFITITTPSPSEPSDDSMLDEEGLDELFTSIDDKD